jgi:hypothetical protein
LPNTQGRRFLWWILQQCGIYRITATGNSLTYLYEGERNVGLKIINQINAVDEAAYSALCYTMAEERKARKAVKGKKAETHEGQD